MPLTARLRAAGCVFAEQEAALRVAHTADLTMEDLQAVRVLLDGAFPVNEAYTEEDHEHALGGVHALLWEGAELIGCGSVVMRRLLHDGQALRPGYVEAVAGRADRASSRGTATC